MKTVFRLLHSIILLMMLMLLMPFISFAADTIRVNIPRVTVTMARNYNILNLPAKVVEKTGATVADGAIKAEYLYSADGSGSVVERNDYYPLGMRTATGNSYPQLTTNLYKYNGKEVQTVGRIGFTDYGARMYDDFTGRWFVPDPLAEKYASMSPYMYCGGNPVLMVDVDGQEVKPKGAKELEMIQNTIPAELRSFVRVNDQGNIDKSLINSYNGNINSGNYNSLKQMDMLCCIY